MSNGASEQRRWLFLFWCPTWDESRNPLRQGVKEYIDLVLSNVTPEVFSMLVFHGYVCKCRRVCF